MNRIGWAGAMLAVVLFMVSAIPASAQEYYARLSGFQEVGGLGAGETGAINSTAQGTLKLTLDKTAQTLTFALTYTFPTMTTTSAGSAPTEILQSHIHFGKEHVAGGIMVYFCSTAALAPPAPAAVPKTCPVADGTSMTVTGTLHPMDVTAKAASQNVLAEDFDALVAALDSGTAYANIHTSAFPSGEIRGQIIRVRDHRRGPGGPGKGNYNGNNGGQNH
jgi:hypothetical protein